MTDGLRELLDEVEAQLAAGEERLTASRELIEAEGLIELLDEDGLHQTDYAPEWAEVLAEPFFIPQGRNELDALFDDYEE